MMVSGAKKIFPDLSTPGFFKKILLKMKIFEIFSDFSGFDCNMVFPYGEYESERFKPFPTDFDQVSGVLPPLEGQVRKWRGTPKFKVA